MNSCYVLTILGLQLRYFLPAYIQLWNYTSILDLERSLEFRTSNLLKVHFIKLNFKTFESHKSELVPSLNFLLCLQVLLLEYLCDACYQKVDIHKYWKNFFFLLILLGGPKHQLFYFWVPWNQHGKIYNRLYQICYNWVLWDTHLLILELLEELDISKIGKQKALKI